MARFSYQQELKTTADASTCQAAALAALQQADARIESTNSPIRARMGSQLRLRLFGAYFAPRSSYPVAVSAEIRDQGGERPVAVEVAEACGFGPLLGAEGRYRSYCQSLLQRLVQELSSRLPAAGAAASESGTTP